MSEQANPRPSAVYHPTYAPVPFAPLRYLREGGTQRTVTLVWSALCMLIVPTGLITRYFHLTGLDLVVAGETLHLTIYLPLLVCIPLTLWFGFFWGAIPAYLSTFLVGVVSGMPWYWIVLFSLSNPLGLGVLVIVYRVAPLRLDLRDLLSVLGYIALSLIAAVAGSAGSFIWAHTNSVGLNDFYPVWQGWWLGGFLQAVVIGGPTLAVLSPGLLRWLQQPRVEDWRKTFDPAWSLAAIVTVLLTLTGFVFAARTFSMSRLGEVLPNVEQSIRVDLSNAVDGLVYSQWIMIMALGLIGFFAWQTLNHWTAALRAANHELAEKNRALVTLSVTDPLTGIFNRRQLFALAHGEFARARRKESQLSVLMIDVDHFKRINDRFGHQIGDQALAAIVERLQIALRSYDILGRYGGEEFMVVLPEAELERGLRVARRLLSCVQDEPLELEQRPLRVSVSIGAAAMETEDQTVDGLIHRADKALMAAKTAGRNRVEFMQRRTPPLEESDDT